MKKNFAIGRCYTYINYIVCLVFVVYSFVSCIVGIILSLKEATPETSKIWIIIRSVNIPISIIFIICAIICTKKIISQFKAKSIYDLYLSSAKYTDIRNLWYAVKKAHHIYQFLLHYV
jgi:hypothetical protein